MTEEQQAAAYLKLQEDVKQLIVDTIHKELQNPGSLLHAQIHGNLLNSFTFRSSVKNVIKDQMDKY
jgi:hypothetical protein